MSLRTRILLLVLLATIAPAAVFGVYLYDERERQVVDASGHLGALAKHAVAELDHSVKGTVQLLHGLSRAPEIETTDRAACSQFLAEVLARYPQYTGLLTITPAGALNCDSLRTGRTLDLRGRSYFKQVSASLQPAFDVVVGGLTGIPVLQVAYPVLDSQGRLASVLLASMDLSEYARRVAAASPFPGLEMRLWNRDGVLLLRKPEDDQTKRVGRDDSASALFRFAASADGDKVVTLRGPSGEDTAWARGAVHESRGGGARLVVGMSPQLLRAEADSDLRTALALMLGVSALAFGLAWSFADSGITRHLEVMASAARRVGKGDLAARAGPPYPRGELGDLMAELDRTAGAVESQRAEILLRNREAQQVNRVLHVLSDINALIVRVRYRDELFSEACRIAVDQGGFVMAWIGMVDAATGRLVPMASAGSPSEFMAMLQQRLSLLEEARYTDSLGARAIREKRAAVSNDLLADPAILCSAEAVKRGSRSMACLPLMAGDDAVGALILYAGEVGAFDAEEMKLLVALAGDIGFAIDHIGKQERLDHLAYYDALTGLANRTLFLERVAQALRGAAGADHGVALLILDLERFRNVNDSLGRPAGDALLRQVAQWLTRFAGDANLVARVDADHFAVMVPEARSGGGLAHLVEKGLGEFLGHPFRLDDAVFRIAAKVGVALSPGDGTDAETLFRNAEAALKRAKATRERYLFHTQNMTDAAACKLTLENQLRQAVDKGEFVLHYQPKVSLTSGEITGLEALIRWNDPRTGLVAPGLFIPMLEETGLIHDVGRWALGQALADCLRWRAAGMAALRVAVNISPLQLRHQGLVTEIEELLATDPGAAAALELEVTESVIMEDVKHGIASLQAIRALGVKVAIDDFGTGFSSLSHLARLPADTLKIDRSFVVDMTVGPEGLALVSTIISLAHSLKLCVVAEGVETEEQSRLLALLGCDEMQGYLFSRPIPANVFEATFLVPRSVDPGNDPTQTRAA